MDLVFLHGTAASSKVTTARAVKRLVGLPVFHNHLTVDLLTTVFPNGIELLSRGRVPAEVIEKYKAAGNWNALA